MVSSRRDHNAGSRHLFPSTLCILVAVAIQASAGQSETLGSHCLTTAECARTDKCALDFCLTGVNLCLSIPNFSNSCPGSPPLVDKTELLDAVNADTNFTRRARLSIIDASIRVFRDLHPHRLLHLNFVGTDPVVVLERLKSAVLTSNGTMPNSEFHEEMKKAFSAAKDRHTLYRAPKPLSGSLAFIPITVVDYYDAPSDPFRRHGSLAPELRRPAFIVSDLALGYVPSKSSFKRGVEIVEWNGLPIIKALEMQGEADGSANEGARLRLGLSSLTFRSLGVANVPDRDVTSIGYVNETGFVEHIDIKWLYISSSREELNNMTAAMSTDVDSAAARIMSSVLKQTVLKGGEARTDTADSRWTEWVMKSGERVPVPVDAAVKDVFEAEIIHFELFCNEYNRLLDRLPSKGLIIDVRGNAGGNTVNLLFTLVPLANGSYLPATYSLRATELITRLTTIEQANENATLPRYATSAKYALQVGDPYTTDFPLLPEEVLAPFIGAYRRPTVLVTDGRTYSAGDGAAAAIIDNNIGVVVGVDESTGGGGSTVISYREGLQEAFPEIFSDQLPADVELTLSIARTLRVGENKGISYEYVGVSPDLRYYPTLSDRLHSDVDLLDFLGKVLQGLGPNDEFSLDPSPEEALASSPEPFMGDLQSVS